MEDLDEIRKLKERNTRLKEDLDMWKDSAEYWMKKYDDMCSKYEPEEFLPSNTATTFKLKQTKKKRR